MQLGVDRVVRLTFGVGLEVNHLIFELYASGNLILTDASFSILLLLRSHQFDETVKYAKGELYPFAHAANLSFESSSLTPENVQQRVQDVLSDGKPLPLKALMTRVCMYMHSQLADHCLREVGCAAPNKKTRLGEVDTDLLVRAGEVARKLIGEVGLTQAPGYLTYTEGTSGKVYHEFTPVLLTTNAEELVETFPTFDAALDQFFSLFEQAKEEEKTEKQESAIWKKKRNIEEDQARRIDALREEQLSSQRKAKLIEDNAAQVDGVIKILTSCLETGVDWKSLWRMVKEEQSKGNPLAQMIVQLKLEKNTAVVLLGDEETGESENVDIDITIGAYQNCREYYENKKCSVDKEKKTTEHMSAALRQAEKKAKEEVMKQSLKLGGGVVRMRKIFWFEKFHWFITSQNFIVVSGNDAQQNEILVKRYMRRGDIYVHADVHGAASTLIKNPTGAPVPLITLEEAGQMCICRSQAWNNKLVTNAYWVNTEQVSKSAPTGMYLSTGSFMIRGKKSFLSPSKLEMGLVLLFKLGEESIAAHLGERKGREEDTSSVYSHSTQSYEETMEAKPAEEPTENTEEAPENSKEEESATVERGQEDVSVPTEALAQRAPKKAKKQKNPPKPKDDPPQSDPSKPLPRGRRNKLRKMKAKYGDQDDEERKVMLELLGTKEVQGFRPPPEPVPEAEEVPEGEDSESSGGEEERKQGEAKEREEIQGIMRDENLLEEELTKTLGELDSLTGKPAESDTLLYCLPMCAPYSSLHQYKFKTKLLPGTQKRGKAIKMVLYTWLNQPDVTPREKELIKQMSESEVIGVLLSGVTVAVPGASKIHKELSKR